MKYGERNTAIYSGTHTPVRKYQYSALSLTPERSRYST